jgi:TonB-dependent SusC/RagA subfamily outer membrane receptor
MINRLSIRNIRTSHRMKKIIAICLTALIACSLSAQDTEQATAIPQTNKLAITRLSNQIKSFPQEKVYLQMDKPYYSAGERLWFRIQMVHASTHIPINLSRYVYIELLNGHNEVLTRKKIRPTEDGLMFGQMDLSPELAQGWYSIRAYTNFMRNVDEAYFFRQRVYIGNSLKGLAGVSVDEKTTSNMTGSGTAEKSNAPFDVQFFPEGGHLIAGNMQVVGFKAIGKNGLGTDINGRIVDETNTEICSFKSGNMGMGKLMFIPLAGKTYTALCEDNKGMKTTIKLPDVSESHLALAVQQTSSIMNVSVLTPNQSNRTDTLYLIGTLRGWPIFQTTVLPESPGYTFSKKNMYSGVTQLLLLNSKCEVLSERNVFISGIDGADLSLKMDKPNYAKRDAVHASIVLKDSEGKPFEGNFSVSVTDDNDVKIDSNETTIKSYLLLQSDLRGFIENPNSYFRPENKNANNQLDVLMLTQGWKRYDTQATLAGNYAKCGTYEVERGPIISGKVQSFPARRGIARNNVSIFFHGKMQFDAVTTDHSGRFEYLSPEFPDSSVIRINADKKENSFLELVVYPDTFPKVGISTVFPDKLKQGSDMKAFLKKSRDRYYYQNGMMSVNLAKVEVVAKKVDKNKKVREDRGAYYSDPSFTFGEEALETATSILDLLIQAPGMTMNSTGDGVQMRNATPLIMVDNMEYTMQELQYIQVTEVKLIDILKDPSETAMYGSKGANGVICIYLKRGEDRTKEPVVLGRHQADISPLGYSMPAEFYVPKYQVEENKQNPLPDLRTTIYWKPVVKSNANGEADLFFYTADGTGTYTIIAEGVSPTGEIIRYQGKMNRK